MALALGVNWFIETAAYISDSFFPIAKKIHSDFQKN
jgi:hypothetical protein